MVSDVEKKAMEYVMQYEREHGGSPEDRSKDGRGYDIESGNKIIEVKGRGKKRPSIVHFNQYNYAAMQRALEENKEYWLYIVTNIYNDDPKLIKMNTTETIKRGKVRHGYDIRLRKADFE